MGPLEVYHEVDDLTETWKNGRPFRYTSLAQVETIIEDFFTECQATGKRPNVSSLALALHIGYKQLCRWEAAAPGETDSEAVRAFKKGLRDITVRAKTRCAAAWWENLEDRDKSRGAEFALKVMGYQDKPADSSSPHSVQVTQNILVSHDSPALGELFAGLLPRPVQKALDKPSQGD